MTLEYLVQTYGYAAIVLGTFLEGETILIVGGFAAHRGYLSLPGVIVSAFIGSLAGDQFWFLIGRRKGRTWIAAHPGWSAKVAKIESRLLRFETPLLIGFRFLYGIRNVTPLLLGACGYSPARFAAFNILGAAVWSIAIGFAGYAFGHALEVLVDDVHRYEGWIAGLVLVAGLAIWWWRRRATSEKLGSSSIR